MSKSAWSGETIRWVAGVLALAVAVVSVALIIGYFLELSTVSTAATEQACVQAGLDLIGGNCIGR